MAEKAAASAECSMALPGVPETPGALPRGGRGALYRLSMGGYRCVAVSVAGFIQQLAVGYLTKGYWFYVTGCVPEGKDACAVDRKLIDRYGVGVSKWARARARRKGHARVQYLRHGRFFVLLATHGQHRFFEMERTSIRDARREPIRYGGYAVSFRGGHAHVRIDRAGYLRMKEEMLAVGTRADPEHVRQALGQVGFEPYAPVRRQLLNIVRAVNRERRHRRLEPLRGSVVRLRRRIVRPFGQ